MSEPPRHILPSPPGWDEFMFGPPSLHAPDLDDEDLDETGGDSDAPFMSFLRPLETPRSVAFWPSVASPGAAVAAAAQRVLETSDTLYACLVDFSAAVCWEELGAWEAAVHDWRERREMT